MLHVTLHEPLDHALLERVVTVRGPGGEPLAGEGRAGAGETDWTWTPDHPWRAGEHAVVVQAVLEDLAGNGVGLPFEVELRGGEQTLPARAPVTLPFVVRAKGGDSEG